MMTTESDALSKAMLLLESDLEARGWDQPIGVYAIGGTMEDPILSKFPIDVQAHPVELLQELWDHGVRIQPQAIGIAVSSEAWRYLTLDEMAERDPERYETFTKLVEPLFEGLSEEERRKRLAQSLTQFQRTRLPGPASMPDSLRRELRSITAVFRTGEIASAMRDRGGEPRFDLYRPGDSKRAYTGRVPEAMTKFLNNERPSEDDEAQGGPDADPSSAGSSN